MKVPDLETELRDMKEAAEAIKQNYIEKPNEHDQRSMFGLGLEDITYKRS